MSEQNSHRQILRSSSIIGGASVVNILISLLRTKVAALLLGPSGVGLIGLFQNLISTAAVVSSLGFGNVGTRQVAEAVGREDVSAVAAARRALFWGTLVLATLGACIFWLFRSALARYILSDPKRTSDVGWLALGVALTVASGSQSALLTGLRRIGDIARVSVASATLSTVLGLGALWRYGAQGLLLFVLATPLASFVIGHLYVARLPQVRAARTPFPEMVGQWQALIKLGAAFMVAGLVVTIGQLAVRTMVQRDLGTDALGQFQAAWAISMTYIGFVLAAMGTDYYPRLTAAIHDPVAVNRMVNEQTEVALLLAGPVFLLMLGLAPWVIDLLYSHRFGDAAGVLRWQVLGDVLKVASWPLGFILLASGDGRTFMLSDSSAIAVFCAFVWFGLPHLGLQATGIGFLVMYAAYLPIVYFLAKRRTSFVWTSSVRKLLALLLAACTLTSILSIYDPVVSAACGIALSGAFGVFGLAKLRDAIPLVAKVSDRFQKMLHVYTGASLMPSVNTELPQEVLLIYGSLRVGGIETMIVRVANYFAEIGFHVSVCCTAGGVLESMLVGDVNVIRYDSTTSLVSLVQSHCSRLHEKTWLLIMSFDPISAAHALMVDSKLDKNLQTTNISGVFHPRAYFMSGERKDRIFINKLVARALGKRCLFFMNEECRQSHSLMWNADLSGCAILPLPIVKTGIAWVNSSPSQLRVISVGRMVDFKAYNLGAPEIVRQCQERGMAVSWDIFGDGPLLELVKAEIEKNAVADRVHLRGTLDYAKFSGVVAEYDLFIGMGTSALEAAMLGVPTICATVDEKTRCYGYIDTLPFGNVGELLSEAPVVELLSLVQSFYNASAQSRQEISRLGRATAERYDIETFSKSILGICAVHGTGASRGFKRLVAEIYVLVTESLPVRLARRLLKPSRRGMRR